VSKRPKMKTEASPWKLLLWTAITGLIFGLMFSDAEYLLRTARNSLHWHKASGDIVLVKIDNQSLRKVGRWPWPRRYHAQLTDRLSNAGSKRIFFDISFFGATNPADDRAFAEALKRSGRVILATRTRSGPQAGTEQEGLPLPALVDAAQGLGTISWQYNFQQVVTGIPYRTTVNKQVVPSFAALLSGRNGNADATFAPDYSVDPKSIPSVSASSILDGTFDRRAIEGKQVVIGTSSEEIGDQFYVPGTGRMAGAYTHIIGAETLKSGRPVDLGWIPLFLIALGVGAAVLRLRDGRLQVLTLGTTAITFLFAPALPEAYHI